MAEGSGADIVAQRFSRGEQVLALDLMFTGAAWKGKDTFELAQMLAGLGRTSSGPASGATHPHRNAGRSRNPRLRRFDWK